MRLISKLALSAAVMTMGAGAQAATVRCSFTEPFISITVDTAAKQVTYLDAIENKTTVHPILENTSTGDKTRIVFGAGQEENSVLEYERVPQGGSDGMSNFVFPYTATTWTGDTNPLIGGCDTPDDPAVDASEAAFPGCWEVLVDQFEDGASYYSAVGSKIITPLASQQKTRGLASFLEQALVVQGYMTLSYDVCRSIDEAVK